MKNSHENEKEEKEEDDDDDIRLTFNDLALPEHIVLGLQKCGFIYPSPVQVSAIPLERLGRDVLVQAKSGTGKTVAFACRLLDSVLLTKVEADVDTFAIDERGEKSRCIFVRESDVYRADERDCVTDGGRVTNAGDGVCGKLERSI